MGKKSKGVSQPNPSKQIAAQEAANQRAFDQTLTANRSNQLGPQGSVKWAKDPATGQWTQTTAYNEPEQALYESQRGNQQQIADMSKGMLAGYDTSSIDLSGAPAMPTVGGYNQQVIDTMRKLQAPGFERARAAKEAQLAAMGIGTGTGAAFNDAQRTLSEAENTADLNAILAGIQQGNTEFGQGMQLHTTGVNDILAERQANLGQLQGILGLGQQLQSPTAGMAGLGPSTSMSGANVDSAYQAAQNAEATNASLANADKTRNMQAVGSAVGSIWGPVGTAVGSGLGKIVGGWF